MDRCVSKAVVTKERPGFWTRRRAFEQVRHGSNIQLLSFSLVRCTHLVRLGEAPTVLHITNVPPRSAGVLPTYRGEAVLGLTVQEAIVYGLVVAGLSIVGTFCWAWRHRSLRKTLIALERERRETLRAAFGPSHQTALAEAEVEPIALNAGSM
jgi:hypothetical protein